jgi:protein TonB
LSAPVSESPLAVPLDVPPSIEVEPTPLAAASSDSTAAAAEAGGVPGGNGGGLAVEAAAPPPAAAVPMRIGEGVDRPRKIKDVRPIYPIPARLAQVVGNVLIEATIGPDGKVQHTRVIRSIEALDQAALDAVRQWEYEPARVNGVPVAVIMVIIVSFALL